MPMHRPWIIACVVCLALGGWLGWRVRGEPPRPNVVKQHRTTEDVGEQASGKAMATAEQSSLQVTPPSNVKRKRTFYHPPTVSCAPADKPCICPGPGPVAEVDETDTTTGQGVIATNAKSASASEQDGSKHRRTEHEGLQHDTYAELPRLSLGVGAAVSPFADERRPAPALGVDVRVYDNYHLQVVSEAQPSELEDLRIVGLFAFPIW